VTQLRSVYLRSIASILLLTAFAKFLSSTGDAKVLEIPEALLPLTNRQTLWLFGLIELAVVLALLLGKDERVKLILVTWLGCNFVLYRLSILLLTVGKPCPCLGTITEKLPVSPATIDWILKVIVAYMVFGSIFFLLFYGRRSLVIEGLLAAHCKSAQVQPHREDPELKGDRGGPELFKGLGFKDTDGV
jgi:hypothetical protein